MAHEKWASGDAYEHFMGRWSEEVATLFVNKLQPMPDSSWLDVGCGTGALARVISASVPCKIIVGVDLSLDFTQYAHQHTPNARFVNASAIRLPISEAAFDFVVSGLALNFVPQPEQALREFVRILKPGGIAAAYVWDYAGKMEFLRYFWDVAVDLNPTAKSLHEGQRFPICNPDSLRSVWESAGLSDISIQPLDAITRFENFEAYWQPFTVGNFPAPQYSMSLNDENHAALHDRLRETIPAKADGSIELISRAWAVFGKKS